MDDSEKSILIEQYGTAYFDDPIVKDSQTFKHDLKFIWNEDYTKIEQINIINIDDNLMIDTKKRYRVILEEIEKIDI